MSMKVLFLTNNDITHPLSSWLEKKENVKLIRYPDKLSLTALKALKPDILISYNYKHLIKKDVLDIIDHKAINLHISLLPWNRGAHPNLWSFLEETPKGVTIHLIDEGIDTGPILLQKELEFDEQKETLNSSYQKLHKVIQELFIKNWSGIKKFNIIPKPQPMEGTMHFKKEIQEVRQILEDNLWNLPIFRLKQILKT